MAGGSAQEKSEEATVRALEQKWAAAYQQREISTVAALLADDYIITTEDGNTYGKIGFLSYNMGTVHVEVAELSDLKIRLYQNVAVVTGVYHEQGESGGKHYDYHDRLTDVWMKSAGKWQLIASHYSVPAKL